MRTLLPLFFSCLAAAAETGKPPAKMNGDDLKKLGWIETARCFDGHEWAYILKKQNEHRVCKGTNSRGGPTERPCEPFNGKLVEFQALATRAEAHVENYDKASHAGHLDQFLKSNPAPHCWELK